MARKQRKEIERIQKKATAWILSNWEINYKKRLAKLRLLPLFYYLELHYLVMLTTLLRGNYNIKLPRKLNKYAVNIRRNEFVAIDKTRTKKTVESFCARFSKF